MTSCPLAPQIPVFFINPDEIPGNHFQNSHAFAVFGEGVPEPFMVIDESLLEQDWFTDDHLLVLMAHELGHILCKTVDEELADLVGMQLLLEAEETSAYELHLAEYKHRLANGHYKRAA